MVPSYFPVLLAWLLTRTTSHERSISIMIRLCFWGIVISTCALSLIAAVMSGFEYVTHQSIQGIHADLIIRSSRALDYQKIQSVIKQEFTHEVQEISPSATQHVIIDTPDHELTIAVAEVIDPATAAHVNNLKKIIRDPQQSSFDQLLAHDNVLLGKTLAEHLNLSVGDTITLMHPAEKQTKKNTIKLESASAWVGGIFATGIDEFDAHGIIVSHAFVNDILEIDSPITHINIKLNSHVSPVEVKRRLAHRLSLDVVSWKELYPQLMSALTLEKYAMVFILSLIVLIASMNTISLLFMFISHKKQTICILFAMGMSRQAIVATFIALGMGITGVATLLGLMGSIGISYALEHYQLIRLPDVYYVNYLPAHMNGTIIISVLVLTLILGFFTAWYPTQMINRKKIAQILKFD